MGSLDKKFEQLQTENTRLKSENMEANRKVESLSDESSAKEEHLRQLQWRLDDERNSKQQGDDLGHRKVHQLSLDLVGVKDKAAQDLSDLSKSLEKVNWRIVFRLRKRVSDYSCDLNNTSSLPTLQTAISTYHLLSHFEFYCTESMGVFLIGISVKGRYQQ